tara:strand:- start:6203 stop:7087 length:885 start_codon:yes stop_codon:yes gene_type:complete
MFKKVISFVSSNKENYSKRPFLISSYYGKLSDWASEVDGDAYIKRVKANDIIYNVLVQQNEVLDLSSLGLSSLPPLTHDFSFVKELNLSSNNLKNLPDDLQYFTNLEKINLAYNKLEKISEKIGLLIHLKYLDLSVNNLLVLPNVFSNLKKIEYLYLSYNYLLFLPKSISSLLNLKIMNIEYNRLLSIPKINLKSLTELQLSSNYFKLSLSDCIKYPQRSIDTHLLSDLESLKKCYHDKDDIKLINNHFLKIINYYNYNFFKLYQSCITSENKKYSELRIKSILGPFILNHIKN